MPSAVGPSRFPIVRRATSRPESDRTEDGRKSSFGTVALFERVARWAKATGFGQIAVASWSNAAATRS
jgi:hypothetical protein